MKSTTNVASCKSGCTQVPAGPQRQSYLVATPAQIQGLQTYLKQSAESVPESLGICINQDRDISKIIVSQLPPRD